MTGEEPVTEQWHTCPTCGKRLDPGVRFCPDDGTPLTDTAAAARTSTGTGTSQLAIQLPLTVGNRYKLVELRGGGGMAKVYKAIDLTLEREVAVKLINPDLRADPEFDARFHREARIASQLADPHIVVVHDFGIDPTWGPYLVMEFLQGQSLRERIHGGPLPMKAALQLGGQMLLALIHAHSKGIVHRDIKPDNVFLLNQSGVRLHVRVLDFGIARIYNRDTAATGESLTRPGAVLGTPRYMSPEQLAGNPVDARSDLYSAALVLYESLTGKLPYVGGARLRELCPDASPVLEQLIEHCLRPEPTDRPASAVEVYLRLQELGKASGVLLLPPGALDKLVASHAPVEPTVAYTPPPSARAGSRRGVWIGLAALLLVAVLGGGGYGIYRLVYPPQTLAAGPEALRDISVGANQFDVVLKLSKEPQAQLHGDPWKGKAADSLGKVLRPTDLNVADVEDLDTLVFHDGQLCVILHKDRVVAVVVRATNLAPSRGGIDVGDSEARLLRLYGDEVKEDTEGKVLGKVYRNETRGIAFEVRDGRVASLTLYPALQAEPASTS